MTDRPRVRSVPSGHPYVQAAVGPLAGPADPAAPGAAPGVWWPHPALDACWLDEHADEVDVLHVHFGFEGRTPAELDSLVGVARARDVSLVLTVHDLVCPHGTGDAYATALDRLVRAADALITLTDAAAAEISRRWGRRATVVPHPTLLDEPPARRRPTGRIGLHLKGLRANVDAHLALDALAGLRPLVGLHRDVTEPAHPRHDATLLPRLRAEDAEVDIHGPLDHAALLRWLAQVDVLVLPYAWGTHSGLVELCRDLGVAAVVPDCGAYADQFPAAVYATGDAASLRAAVLRARPVRVDHAARLREREDVRARHAAVYASLRAGRRVAA